MFTNYRESARLTSATLVLLAMVSCSNSNNNPSNLSEALSDDTAMPPVNQNDQNTNESVSPDGSMPLPTPVYAGVLDVSDGQNFEFLHYNS